MRESVLKIDKDDRFKNEEKLAYVLKQRKLRTKDIAKKLGVQESLISQIKSYYESSNKLRNIHIYAICFAYDIPIEIFEDKSIDTKIKIDGLLNQKQKETTIFHHNSEILDKLVGVWYMYSYTSNPMLGEIWETKSNFYDDYSVEDEHKNRGNLYIGKHQSVILKESNGSKNITTITFDNSRVFYGAFLFSRISKSNSINKELFNFGLCSKKRLDKELVREVLGEKNEVQLQVSYDILERIGLCIRADD